MKPEHTAWTSNAAPRVMPRRACTLVAVAGKVLSGDAVAYLVEEAVDLEVDGDADGVGEAMRIGAAMALDADALQAEEDGAVVAPRIEPLAPLVQRACRQPIADARRQRILEGRAQELGIEPRRALGSLDRDVAGEAVRHHHVDGPGADVVALDEAVKADGRTGAAQARARAAHGVIALQILGADVEQAYRRLLHPEHGAREDVAHQRELHEVVGV